MGYGGIRFLFNRENEGEFLHRIVTAGRLEETPELSREVKATYCIFVKSTIY